MNLKRLRQALLQPPETLGIMPTYRALRPRFHLHWVDQADSTNQVLAEMMAAGAPSGTALVATTQRLGRGQWGRQWQSPAGGLYLSLGIKPELPADRSHYLTLASAWGVATSLANLSLPVQVKWPNDLVIEGKKLGGVLAETRIDGGMVQDVVIGLGLNGFNPVPPTGISIQQLIQPETAAPALKTLEGLAAIALYGLMQGYLHWQNQGDEAFLDAYQARLANLGQVITLEGEPAEVIGVAPSGNLQVQVAQTHNHSPVVETLEIQPGKVTLGYNA
ncbi:biotin--[acetyl-CoA-carboxylase] ligase [Nodosilinea sp. LEGE 07088]|uniref:biotin--[acetyl-CoA-carboxylase] ligase n=1 Tax=Nodosilinea sp. LEGE 07088 TaxID=2777968 RepID=UPI00188083FC|nr:biotin--[acetyl-CoA-carboxylase] ligase [Nodosilinea sp. LEGE 07088]MBE9137422.1 biotin--[acetyl-CoA-carboxylase] ligase [Nodosilinea sp. LEGE 07088]